MEIRHQMIMRSLFCFGMSLTFLGIISSLPVQAKKIQQNISENITKSNNKLQAVPNFIRTRTLNVDEQTSIFTSRDGKILTTASHNGTIKLFSLPNGKLIHTLSASSGINSIALSPDKQTLVTTSGDSKSTTISIMNAHTGQVINSITDYKSISSITITPDGKNIVTYNDKAVYILDLKAGKLIRMLPNSGSLNIIKISPDGQYLVGAGTYKSSSVNDRILRTWNLKTGKLLQNIVERGLFVRCMSISSDSKTFAVGKGGSDTVANIETWNLVTGKLIKKFGNSIEDRIPEVTSIALSPDGQFLITGNYSMDENQVVNIDIWNSRTGKKLHSISSHVEAINTITTSADGRTMISTGNDKKVIIWQQK